MIFCICTYLILCGVVQLGSRNISKGEVSAVTGRVKWFNNEKGYGFIEYKEDEDIFVHYSAIKLEGYKTLTEGQIITFQLIETPKGLQALNVEVADELKTTK